jgi:hypothetical protein
MDPEQARGFRHRQRRVGRPRRQDGGHRGASVVKFTPRGYQVHSSCQ